MRRTYLIAFIDDATRLVPYAAFFFAQREFQLEQAFKWATLRYGLPDQVYVDNGKIFVSDAFKLACARLNVRHAHTAPYAPESKGKIERFMGRVDSFLAELALSPARTLEALNDTFTVWLGATATTRRRMRRSTGGRRRRCSRPIPSRSARSISRRCTTPSCARRRARSITPAA